VTSAARTRHYREPSASVMGVLKAPAQSGAFFLSTSRRNQWALDALGKQPVAHFPPPVLGRLFRA
jgi:hypothetical protein